jgi:hypothetical protein
MAKGKSPGEEFLAMLESIIASDMMSEVMSHAAVHLMEDGMFVRMEKHEPVLYVGRPVAHVEPKEVIDSLVCFDERSLKITQVVDANPDSFKYVKIEFTFTTSVERPNIKQLTAPITRRKKKEASI